MTNVLQRQIRAYGLALGGVVALTLGLLVFHNLLTLANITLFFLLLVLVVAVGQGTRPAFLTAVTSLVCINFFFVEPRFTLLVADAREVLDLAVFMGVAAIGGRLAASARQQAQIVRQGAAEQAVLYRLAKTFNQMSTTEAVCDALTQIMREDLNAVRADVLPFSTGAPAPDLTTHYLLLQAGERVYGTLRVAFDGTLAQPRADLLAMCAEQAATSLQRIDLNERARKSRQFEEADRLKTALLHSVSHDLRTPITIIKTSAHNLRQFAKTLSDDEQAEIAATIETESDQLDNLVGNLLDLSRLNAGALHLSSAPNSLEDVASDVAARIWQLTKQERIKLIFPDDMPLVEFDYGLLLQAVTNLVDNAVRYEPPSQLVELRGEVQKNKALLKVVNHGETIAESVKEHMMEPFYKGWDGHIGLGLPIAKGIVEAHHGELLVEDTPGTGATFIIVLPLKGNRTHLETQNIDC
ncbi:MAG: DUF4118 domain-containing protein [Anaerolineae bacterium]